MPSKAKIALCPLHGCTPEHRDSWLGHALECPDENCELATDFERTHNYAVRAWNRVAMPKPRKHLPGRRHYLLLDQNATACGREISKDVRLSTRFASVTCHRCRIKGPYGEQEMWHREKTLKPRILAVILPSRK